MAMATAIIRILALAAVVAAFAVGPSWAAEPEKTLTYEQWLDRLLKSDRLPEWQKRAVRAEMAGDFKTAAKLARQGAEAEDGMGFMMLGAFYEIGQGVEKDLRKAAEYYGKSVDSGIKLAGALLGYLHLNGLGVPRDRALAIQYFRLAVAVIANFPGIKKTTNPSSDIAACRRNCLMPSLERGALIRRAARNHTSGA